MRVLIKFFPAKGTPERQYSIWASVRYIEGIEDVAVKRQTNGTSKLCEAGIKTLFSFHQLEHDVSVAIRPTF